MTFVAMSDTNLFTTRVDSKELSSMESYPWKQTRHREVALIAQKIFKKEQDLSPA